MPTLPRPAWALLATLALGATLSATLGRAALSPPRAPTSAELAQWGTLAAVNDLAATEALRQAARTGSVPAQQALGRLLVERPAEVAVAEGRHWLEQAAGAGVADAQFLLGQMLLAGDGAAADPTQARLWFEKAAEQEHPEANLQLLMARSRGELGFARNAEATAQQFIEAQHSLRHRPPAP